MQTEELPSRKELTENARRKRLAGAEDLHLVGGHCIPVTMKGPGM